jgi:hypothetical protein
MGLSFLLAAFALAVVPAQAQNVDEKIKALEQELSQLKSDQMELRKDATAAAAALPNFSYRPGNGMLIEAADKSWSVRMALEGHMRMLFESGRDQIGRTNGEIMGRRFRPEFYYCVNNCLYEIEAKLDLDGFGTGNAWNSTKTAATSILQRGVFHFHGENISPWLPTVSLGMDVSTAAAATVSRQGSSATGAQREYDILSRQVGPNTGRSGNGITLTWDNRSLSSIGIPGRIGRFQVGMANISEGDDGASSFTDRKDFNIYGNIQPFSQTKNKWLSGLYFEVGTWFCNVDKRVVNGTGNTENGCDRVRLRDHGDAASQTMFDTGSDSIGGGLVFWVQPGITWEVGPYKLRAVTGYFGAQDGGATGVVEASPGKKRANNFLIGHDLWLWSPKGFLTGSPTTPGSILVGTHFERNNVSCQNRDKCSSINGGDFHRERLLLREWDIYYFIAPRMSVGLSVLWYDASNLREGRNQAAHNLGVCSSSKIASGGCRQGIGGDWTDVSLDWRYNF